LTNPTINNSDFVKEILELKKPISSIKINEDEKYQEFNLYLNGKCKVNVSGEEIKADTFIINNYYLFIRSFMFPPIGVLSPSGSLSSFFDSYWANIGEK